MGMLTQSKKQRESISSASRWVEVSKDQPCPMCGKSGWCKRTLDGQCILCRRELQALEHAEYSFTAIKEDRNGVEYTLWQRKDSDEDQSLDSAPLAPPAQRDIVYQALLNELPLPGNHKKQLVGRGLGTEFHSRGWYSTWNPREFQGQCDKALSAAILAAGKHEIDILSVPGFSKHDGSVVFRAAYGLLIPIRDIDGAIIGLKVRRDPTENHQAKYVCVSSAKYGGPSPGALVHVPAFDLKRRQSVRVTEGELKADAITAMTGTLTLSIPGVQSYGLVLPVLRELQAKRVYVAFDADCRTNPDVARSLFHFISLLRDEGFEVMVETWEPALGKGLDDVLAAGNTPEKLRGEFVEEFQQELEHIHGEFAPVRGSWIDLSADLNRVNEQAAKALSHTRRIFDYGHVAVRIVNPMSRNDESADLEEKREPARIVVVDQTMIADELSRHAGFQRWDGRQKKSVAVNPPPEVVKHLHQNLDRYSPRELAGVVSHPILRADGSIFSRNGYDTRTRLYLDQAFPDLNVPTRPSQRQVRNAVRELKQLVSDFPFAEEAGFSAWLAMCLTLLTRHLYRGNTPLFLVEAAKSGTGKGLLVDAAALIVTGHAMSRSAFPDAEAEVQKTITSHILEGHRAVLFDNVRREVDSQTLEAAITAERWSDRLLGTNRMMNARMHLLFAMTANNPKLSPDQVRRTLSIRIESPVERPDQRDDFQIDDLEGAILEQRPALLANLLTIARGYIQADRPREELPKWGSFTRWSLWIREMVVWAGCSDPADTRESLRKRSDNESVALASLLADLEAACQKNWLKERFLARDVLGLMLDSRIGVTAVNGQQTLAQSLRSAIELYQPSVASGLSVAALGKLLSGIAGRIEGGKRLVSAGVISHTLSWRIETVA